MNLKQKLFGEPLEKFGNDYQLRGVIVGGSDKQYVLVFPNEHEAAETQFVEPTTDEWLLWLKQSDDPYFETEVPGLAKAIIRKSARQIDQNIIWECYRRAKFKCEYCQASDRPLTYDHYLAQKFGGLTTLENGVAACRPCNKAKGHKTTEEWKEFMDKNEFNYSKRFK